MIEQNPSQAELLAIMMKETSQADSDRADLAANTTMMFSISEEEIVVSHEGAMLFGGPMTSRYTVEGDRLLLQHQSIGLLSMLTAKYLPEYFQYRSRGAQLELISSPVPAYENRQIRYLLELQNQTYNVGAA